MTKQVTLVKVETEEISPEEQKRRDIRNEYKARIRAYMESREIELETKKDKFYVKKQQYIDSEAMIIPNVILEEMIHS